MISFNKKKFKNLKIFSDGSCVIGYLNVNTQLNSNILFLEKDFKSFEILLKEKSLKNSNLLNVSFKYRKFFLSK
jgi:hypothetical protein